MRSPGAVYSERAGALHSITRCSYACNTSRLRALQRKPKYSPRCNGCVGVPDTATPFNLELNATFNPHRSLSLASLVSLNAACGSPPRHPQTAIPKALAQIRRPLLAKPANTSGQRVPPPKPRHPDPHAGARDRMLEKLGSGWCGVRCSERKRGIDSTRNMKDLPHIAQPNAVYRKHVDASWAEEPLRPKPKSDLNSLAGAEGDSPSMVDILE